MAAFGFICLPFSFFRDLNILCPKEIDFCEKLNFELSFLKLCNDKIVTHMDFISFSFSYNACQML